MNYRNFSPIFFPRSTFYFLLFLFITIFISCSSSTRYTFKERSEDKSHRENSYSKLKDTYSNYKSLESKIVTASYYSDEFNGKKTANGEIYNMYDYTAAHISYPFNTIVRVTNLSNNREVILRINDRKPDTNGTSN